MQKIKLDTNNIESGIWLPEEMRYYTSATQYVHKYGLLARALQASIAILS